MVESDERRPSIQPLELPVAEPPDSEVDSRSGMSGEDFLYHLYRGNELLQDNFISEAKEELERALSLQPQDVEGQGLLGVVYFRLGLYPRAIQIYEEIVRQRPKEVTPLMNLALCYLKTGQLLATRQCLEKVIDLVPEHPRAWGYLGLVLQRLGDLSRAVTAFERAGQPRMAERMRELVEQARRPSPEPSSLARIEVQEAASDAAQRLQSELKPFSRAAAAAPSSSDSGDAWRAVELRSDYTHRSVTPAPLSIPAITDSLAAPALKIDLPEGPISLRVPASTTSAGAPAALAPAALAPAALAPAALAPAALVPEPLSFPASPGIARRGSRHLACRLDGNLAVRVSAIRAVCAEGKEFETAAVRRRVRGQEQAETLGSPAQPLVWFRGSGGLVLAARRSVCIVELAADPVYVRQSALLCFEGTANYECGRLAGAPGSEMVSVVQLSGSGILAFECDEGVSEVAVGPGRGRIVHADVVVGWTGRLFSRAVDPERVGGAHGFVGFEGDGAIYVDL